MASTSFIRLAGSSSSLYEPEVAGSSRVASAQSVVTSSTRPSTSASVAAARPSTSAPMAAARPSTSASVAAARPSTSAPGFGICALPEAPPGRSGYSNFFDFRPIASSTPLAGLDETGPIGDVPTRARRAEFGDGPAVASSANAAGNQAAGASVHVEPIFRPVARRYEHMPLNQARRTVKKKAGEVECYTLWVGRLRQEVDAARLRMLFQQLGYDRIEKVRTGFGDSPYGDGTTHYYGWVTFADLDKAVDCRYRWDGRSDWGLTPKDERSGVRRFLHMSFCNNTKYAPELVGDHGDHSSDIEAT